MGRDRRIMVELPRGLNLGCGYKKHASFVNVDAYPSCDPDIVWDLNKTPWPWAKDNEFDEIHALHVFEHLPNWWGAFKECARVLKPGGILYVAVPDESSKSALTYRDHVTVFSPYSFHGLTNKRFTGTNAWAEQEEQMIPLRLLDWKVNLYPQYAWMTRWPFKRLAAFCVNHLRNFAHEQVYTFAKES